MMLIIPYVESFILPPTLFMSEMKVGYETFTDSESDTVQSPTYMPAIQNAINNL
jgi:hypothetical protein